MGLLNTFPCSTGPFNFPGPGATRLLMQAPPLRPKPWMLRRSSQRLQKTLKLWNIPETIVGALIRFKVNSLIKGFWSLGL